VVWCWWCGGAAVAAIIVVVVVAAAVVMLVVVVVVVVVVSTRCRMYLPDGHNIGEPCVVFKWPTEMGAILMNCVGYVSGPPKSHPL
jgi:hypothetical protein